VGVTRLSASSQFVILGVDPKGFLVRACRIHSGRVLEPGAAEIMVGRSAARRLDLAAGDRVEILRRYRFAVVGVYETGRGLFDSAAVVDLGDAQRMFRFADDVSLAFLEVAPPEAVGQVVAAIADELPGLDATASDLWVSSFEQLDVVRQFARTMALVALVLAAVGIANTMTTSVVERRAELAILRAVGWAKWRVAGTVLIEALVAAVAGGALGLGAAAGAVAVLHRFSSIWFAPATVGAGLALEGVGLTLAAAVLGCVPALVHAVRIAPAAALRAPA
jgi:putative ABC transport system permease protein